MTYGNLSIILLCEGAVTYISAQSLLRYHIGYKIRQFVASYSLHSTKVRGITYVCNEQAFVYKLNVGS